MNEWAASLLFKVWIAMASVGAVFLTVLLLGVVTLIGEKLDELFERRRRKER